MKTLMHRALATAGVLSVGVLSACGNMNAEADAPASLNTAGIAQADANEIAGIIPTQSQISDKETFSYLIANPIIEKFEPQSWFKSSPRNALWNADQLTDNATAIQESIDRCAAYEQVAPGLIATPSEDWLVSSIDRREILIGQSDVNQIAGYSQVVATPSASDAANLFAEIKNQTNSCSNALKAVYPQAADQYSLRSPSIDPQSGTVTLAGTYRGQKFQLSVTHRDRYLISTWFKTQVSPESDVRKPTGTIHSLAVSNAEAIPAKAESK
ncbi:hypothetical protein [Rothia sp. ZJ1223]|uniref:hypothetical protein n=1 Tax=Rothia sp. ZJ1223 TaxID=2811098 RepID=UPI00195DECDA|nr:hypothetical protein [Rothia sp. ZJ1223]MBM7051484.1 hypothetical protein [Rothia sp. ZJ1223]